MTIDRRKSIILIMAAALCVAAAFLLFYQKGAFLSDDINWQDSSETFEDGEVSVRNRAASIKYNGREVWHSAWNVNVQQCVLSDIDNDGHKELLMLVWKRGSYGSHRPFWVKHNDNDLAQHIFIYKWEEDRESKLRAIWMSSAISDSIDHIDTGKKGKIFVADTDGSVKAWYWEGFGLKLLSGNCKSASVIALGDQLLNLPVIRQGLKSGDYSYLYGDIAKKVQSYDLASLNQETVYVKDHGLISDYPRFGSPEEIAQSVKDMGIDVVSLANNHALDKEMYGIDCSIDINRSKGIIPLGVHSSKEDASDYKSAVTFIDINEIRFGLLSFTYGTNGIKQPDKQPYAVELLTDKERMIKALDYAREEADCVIVYAHFGTEYMNEPDDFQKECCEVFVNHGVDVVIGTHPHVIQKTECIACEGHDMLVYYSLGNLVSHQTKEECKIGAAATFDVVKLYDKKVEIVNYDTELMNTYDRVTWIK